MPSPRRARRKPRRGRRIAAVAVSLIAVIIAAALVESGRSHHGAPLPASLPENLQLSGVISGLVAAATAIQGMTSTFPSGQGSNGLGRINATACVQNASDGWEVDLYGQVGAHRMSLSLDAQVHPAMTWPTLTWERMSSTTTQTPAASWHSTGDPLISNTRL